MTIRVAEYFAGIGLARLGFEAAGMEVVWSNDISPKKLRLFNAHFGSRANHKFELGDLRDVVPNEMPGFDVAWASFPCTDLSLAGSRGGLGASASSAFWLFIKNLSHLGPQRPRVIALENVSGFATSRAGRDLTSAIRALNGLGYSVDVLNIDARHFVPQSRPRLFLLAVQGDLPGLEEDAELRPTWLDSVFSNPTLRTHQAALPGLPPLKTTGLTDLVENLDMNDPRWWDATKVADFVASLSPVQLRRFEELRDGSTLRSRTAFRRMRSGVPRWEMRADDIAGCLRTARGGSSRQAILTAGQGRASLRWMTPREYARLMGADDFAVEHAPVYDAYSGFGDAVCVPVVAWIAEHYIRPLVIKSAEQPLLHLGSASA